VRPQPHHAPQVDPRYNNARDVDALLLLAEDDPLPQADIPPASELDGMTAAREWRARVCG
jgi:hypothetical protein